MHETCLARSREVARVDAKDSSGARHTGLAENIDDDGALIVTGTSGTLRIRSGEVRWL